MSLLKQEDYLPQPDQARVAFNPHRSMNRPPYPARGEFSSGIPREVQTSIHVGPVPVVVVGAVAELT